MSNKTKILQIKSLAKKDLDDTRNNVIGIINSNPESITFVIDKPSNGDYYAIMDLAEMLRLADCNVNVLAQGNLDLSGLLAVSSLKAKRGKRIFSSFRKTNLSGLTSVNQTILEDVTNFISSHSKADKAEIFEWINNGITLNSDTLLQKKLVDDINIKKRRVFPTKNKVTDSSVKKTAVTLSPEGDTVETKTGDKNLPPKKQ